MYSKMPHIVQYQGSKRLLAPLILQYMPKRFDRLVEPFSGMAAITIAAASDHRASRYIINDINKPLVSVLRMSVESPAVLIADYSRVWNDQFSYQGGHIEHYYHVRDRFNSGEQTPEHMLYLLARCVKGSPRYGKSGNFNQSPDKRRHGTNPQKIADSVSAISKMLKNKADFFALDYRNIIDQARSGDLVYMDPPYQGVSNTRDNRYLSGVDYNSFIKVIKNLNDNNIDFIISYDGECGGKEYGNELPKSLQCGKILLNAGLSAQATLLGKRATTLESLYISKNLGKYSNSSLEVISRKLF